ncbi:MAG: SGNH/GDSL hydrolase family protein [Clostridia bacterium]|nr:SGNH/GDSL hydrolase family protein [Clostridia bacterium]
MKRCTAITAAVLSVIFTSFALGSCAVGVNKNSSGSSSGAFSSDSVQSESSSLSSETTPPEAEIPDRAISLASSNRFNTATAYFDASYSEEGVMLDAYVKDDDIKTDIFYSSGFNDNVEYLIGLEYDAGTGWNAGNTLHFLITADGNTVMQRAVSADRLGEDYAFELLCVNGWNFRYSYEYTDYGYKNSVFLSYELFGVTAAEGKNNLYVCPAMRNTHDYADSVWTPFKESGCNWSNASSFIRVDENKGYMTDFKKEADVLFLGDSQLDTAYWRTYTSDVGKKGIMNMASSGTKISDWRGRAQALAEYNPKKIVLYAGMDEVNGSAAGQSAEKIAEEIGLTADSLSSAMPGAKLYVVTLAGASDGSNAEKIARINALVKQTAGSKDWTAIDAAGRLSENGRLKKGFAAPDGVHLNQMGYNALSALMRQALDLAGGSSASFGDGSMYFSSAAVKETPDGITVLDGVYDQYTYFQGCGSEEFYAETQLCAETVYNADPYPKFGIVVSSASSTLFFYVSGYDNLSANTVGYVKYEDNNTWNWSQSVESTCEISYSNGEFCGLSVLKYQGSLFLFVNGEVVFTIDDLAGYGIAGKCDVGILAFNTKLSLRSAFYTESGLENYIG